MRLKKLTKLLLVMVISLMTILALSVCASADVNNGTGGGKAGIENAKKGVGVDDFGYRFYLTDLDGKLISDEYGPCVMDVMGSKTSDHFNNVYTDALKYNMTRVTESTVSGYIQMSKTLPADCPKPVTVSGSNFTGKGADFKNWMASKCTLDTSCKTNAQYIVKTYFNSGAFNEFKKGKYKLIAEPIVLCPLYGDYSTTQDIYGNGVQVGPNRYGEYSSYSGYWMFGTFYEMALANDKLQTITGVSHPGRAAGYMMPVKDALGECMYLEDDDLELKAPGNVSGIAGNINKFIHWDMRNGNISTLKNIGLGLHIYYTDGAENGVIHTYDIVTNPDKPAPAETPDEENNTAGDKQIIKCYVNVYKGKDGKYIALEDAGTFQRDLVTNKIAIVNEKSATGYTLEAWSGSSFYTDNFKDDDDNIITYSGLDWARITRSGTFTRDRDERFDRRGRAVEYINGKHPYFGTTYSKFYDDTDPLLLSPISTKSIYLLYYKVFPYIKTYGDPDPTPDVFYPEDPSDPDKKGEFTIVKCYGRLNPVTLKVENIKTTYKTGTTYNVLIEQEPGYKLQEYHVVDAAPNTGYTSTQWGDFDKNSPYAESIYAEYGYYRDFDYEDKAVYSITGLGGNDTYSNNVYCKSYLSDSDGTLYLLYLKCDEIPEVKTDELIITESYITKRFKLGDSKITVTSGDATITELFRQHYFVWEVPSIADEVSNHDRKKGFTDKRMTMVIDQTEELTQADGVIPKWTKVTEYSKPSATSFKKTWSSETTGARTLRYNGLEYVMVLTKIDDTFNIIDYRAHPSGYSAGSTLVSNVDIVNSGNGGVTRQDAGEYTYSFDLTFECDEEASDLMRKYKVGDYYYPWNSNVRRTRWSYIECEATFDYSTAISSLTENVRYFVYAGKEDSCKVNEDFEEEMYEQGDNFVVSGLQLSSEELVEFYPYIQMQYDSATMINNRVFVAGQFKRGFMPNEYTGISFYMADGFRSVINNGGATDNSGFKMTGKIAISSKQWSTHATATKYVNNQNCVLPGGATLDIAVLKEARQALTVEAYYPILTGSGLKQVEACGFTSNLPTEYQSPDPDDEEDIESEYEEYLENIVEALETLNVQQWVSGEINVNTDGTKNLVDIKKSVWDMPNAEAVGPKADGSTEDKYYFRDDDDDDTDSDTIKSSDGNTGDVDVNPGETVVEYMTFFTTTNGEIRVKISNNLTTSSTIYRDTDGVLILKKTQKLSEMDTIYKTIDAKTGIITKLYEGLERNTGEDKLASWAKDESKTLNDEETWYNEAFDGITYVHIKTQLSVGFINPFERTSVLDPELCPISNSKDDFFQSYRLSQFKMKNYCEKYGPAYPGKVGEHEGHDIILEGLDMLFASDIFYIPNVTVQDLR